MSFVINKIVTPVYTEYQLQKRQKTKVTLDDMVQTGKLSKVDDPTDWCSNMTVVEKIKANGDIKTRICVDLKRTINHTSILKGTRYSLY